VLKVTTIAGSDDTLVYRALTKQAALLGENYERLDMASSDSQRLTDLLRSATLFGSPRSAILYNVDADTLSLIEDSAALSSSEIIVTYTGRLTPKIASRFEALGSLLKVPTPSKLTERTALISSIAKDSKIILSSLVVTELATRLESDWARVCSIVDQLYMANILNPTLAQVSVLMGTSTKQTTPWDITDAAAKGHYIDAISFASDIEPVVLSSWVGSETLRLVATYEKKLTSSTCASLLGVAPFRAQKYVAWAKGLTHEKASRALFYAGELELAAKSRDAKNDVIVALSKWLIEVAPKGK
jgi:DNA polymerase III delta subunit